MPEGKTPDKLLVQLQKDKVEETHGICMCIEFHLAFWSQLEKSPITIFKVDMLVAFVYKYGDVALFWVFWLVFFHMHVYVP